MKSDWSEYAIVRRKPRELMLLGGSGGATGKGGGGGGTTPTFVEDPDTLANTQWARVIDVLSEGPIGGFIHKNFPLLDIYLDNTPIQNNDAWAVLHDGITINGSKTFKATSDVFYEGVVGRYLDCPNYPAGTRVSEVIGTTPSRELKMSNPATAGGTGVQWQMGGSLNFENFSYWFQPGTQNQPWVSEFAAEEVTTAVGVRVRKDTPWEQSFSDVLLDAIRIDVQFPKLQEQDTETGAIHGTTVHIKILMSTGGAGFQVMIDDTLTGKASSAYVRTYKIELADHPSSTGWTVRVERVTADSQSQALLNETWVQSYSELIYGKLTYPNTAYVAFKIDAQQFPNIPVRAYHVEGLKVKIPSNYNPDTRVYTGVWDGTFVAAVTDNPAWCWYDIATNSRYGLGNQLIEANIDKWTLYTIAKYCDALVNDGFGGQEPRFRCNLYLQRRADAIRVLQDMAGIFRGMLAYINGTVTPVQDAPTDPSSYRMFSPANVIGGTFSYSGVSLRARHNAALVSWNDPEDQGRIKWEYVEDHDGLVKAGGLNQLEITGFGCTSRAQARRIGLWAVYGEKILTDTVAFSTALEGYFITPGQLITIQDPFRSGAQYSGRLKAGTTTTLLLLDQPVNLYVGHTYTVSCMNPTTNELENRAVTTTPDNLGHTVLNVSPGFSVAPEKDTIFQIADVGSLVPEFFRVLSVVSKEDNVLEVVALQYNASLYDFVDFDHPLTEPPISRLPGGERTLPPAPPLVIEDILVILPTGVRQDLEMSWGRAPDPFLSVYRPTWRMNNGNWIGAMGQYDTTYTQWTLENVTAPGFFEFKIYAVNTLGVLSIPLEGSFQLDVVPPLGRVSITGLELWGQGNNNAFQQRDAHFVWRVSAGEEKPFGLIGGDDPNPLLVGFIVSVWNVEDKIFEEFTNRTEFTFTWELNKLAMETKYGEGTSPLNHFRFEVRASYSDNTVSEPAALDVINPPPGIPTNASVEVIVGGRLLKWANPANPDLERTEVFMAESVTARPTQVGSEAFPGTAHIYYTESLQELYFWLCEVDTFGNKSALFPVGWVAPGRRGNVRFDPPSGFYNATPSLNVVLTSKPDVTIWFAKVSTVVNTPPIDWQDVWDGTPILIDASYDIWTLSYSDSQPFPEMDRSQYKIGTGWPSRPIFDPPGYKYVIDDLPFDVEISCNTTGAQLVYTLDGSTPVVSPLNGTLIPAQSGIVSLTDAHVILKALAFKSGLTDSQIITNEYTFIIGGGEPGSQHEIEEIIFNPAAGEFITFPTTVTLATPSVGSVAILYTLDGTIPTPDRGTLIANGDTVDVDAGQVLRAIAVKTGWKPSPVKTGKYKKGKKLRPPFFTPPPGAYNTFPKPVRMKSQPGSQIVYTLDGTEPVSSPLNGTLTASNVEDISVAANQTIKALATKTNFDDSVVTTGLYSQKVATPTHTPDGLYYATSLSVTIATSTSGALIKITQDGTDPSPAHGTLVTSGSSITISNGYREVRSVAYLDATHVSEIKLSVFDFIGGA